MDQVALAQALEHFAERSVRFVELVDAAAGQGLHLVEPALAHEVRGARQRLDRPDQAPAADRGERDRDRQHREPGGDRPDHAQHLGALAALDRVEVQADRPRLAAVRRDLAVYVHEMPVADARTHRARMLQAGEQGSGAVGRAQPLEHRVAELGQRRERPRRVRAPLGERGVTEHAIVVIEHERRDLVFGAEHGEILGDLRDRHHLPEHAHELPGAVQRHLVQERRRPLGGLKQERPPRRPRLHLSRGKPFAYLGARGPVVAQRAQLAAAPSLCPARGVHDADVGYLGGDAERAEHEAVELFGARELDAAVVERLGDPVGLLVDRAQARGEALLERVEQRLGLLPDQSLGRAPARGGAHVQGNPHGGGDE